MIVDTSALIASAQNEPEAAALSAALQAADTISISASTLLEACIVIDGRRSPLVTRRFEEVLASTAVTVVPFGEEHLRVARAAYRDYGRGSGHPANLNFGDCFSYALAAERREPLLYVGDDFVHTDIRSALAD